jgi:hypothetical protein
MVSDGGFRGYRVLPDVGPTQRSIPKKKFDRPIVVKKVVGSIVVVLNTEECFEGIGEEGIVPIGLGVFVTGIIIIITVIGPTKLIRPLVEGMNVIRPLAIEMCGKKLSIRPSLITTLTVFVTKVKNLS